MKYNFFPSINAVNINTKIYLHNKIFNFLNAELKTKKAKSVEKIYINIDFYYGVSKKSILDILNIFIHENDLIEKVQIIDTSAFYKKKKQLEYTIQKYVTSDDIFGKLTNLTLHDVFDTEKIKTVVIKSNKQIIFTIGVGTQIVTPQSNYLIYFDINRWTIQKRLRKGMPNFLGQNQNDSVTKKFKYGYFFSWRLLDRYKKYIWNKISHYVDANNDCNFKLINFHDYLLCLNQVYEQPFRVVPYFDQGVWGGKWIQTNLNINRNLTNIAWGFDCVLEENSLCLKFKNQLIETPALNLLINNAKKLLGKTIFAIFGEEFPIRTDFLDTVSGGNLSLQVHPSKKYIKEQFNMPYTQDESYYILDCKQNSNVFLGFKNNVNSSDFKNALALSVKTKNFQVEKYVNNLPCNKHDHFAIPNGTVHCSGKNILVYEISSTPYIFTMKLWDWNRLDLNGQPRTINIERGIKNIDFEHTYEWLKQNNLISKFSDNKKSKIEKTLDNKFEFVKTSRHWFSEKCVIPNCQNFQIFVLVEGEEIECKSVNNKFASKNYSFAETFIVPQNLGKIIFTNKNLTKMCAVLSICVDVDIALNNHNVAPYYRMMY